MGDFDQRSSMLCSISSPEHLKVVTHLLIKKPFTEFKLLRMTLTPVSHLTQRAYSVTVLTLLFPYTRLSPFLLHFYSKHSC